MKISATLVTLNEERNLPRALESLRWCDEIVVVDSGSSDRTREIARSHGARVIENEWPGYAKQKNLAAEAASHDWILSLDADERLSPELEQELRQLRSEGPRFDAYSMPRLARYLGRWIRHGGWYPDRKIRLYDRRKARWAGAYVHEAVSCDGAIGELQSDLLHDTCETFSDHIRTVDRYTTLAAQEMAAAGRRVSLPRLLLAPPWTFVRTYFLRLGALDGWQGFLIASMAAFYVFAKYVKARTPDGA